MNFLKQNVTTILIVVLAIAVTVLVMILTKKPQVSEEMIVNRERVKHLEEIRLRDSVQYEKDMSAKDSIIQNIKDDFAATTPKLQQSRNETKKIPVVINSLNNNELLNRANSFTPR